MKIHSDYIRSFVFGVEDSLVSTVGLVSGVAAVGSSKGTILLSGIILIFVEAFSMSVGSLLSENSAQEYNARGEVSLFRSLGPSLVMFGAYFCSGFIVLLPYILLSPDKAFTPSVVVALISLFILGAFSAKLSQTSLLRNGLTMALIGGGAVLIGVFVGNSIQ